MVLENVFLIVCFVLFIWSCYSAFYYITVLRLINNPVAYGSAINADSENENNMHFFIQSMERYSKQKKNIKTYKLIRWGTSHPRIGNTDVDHINLDKIDIIDIDWCREETVSELRDITVRKYVSTGCTTPFLYSENRFLSILTNRNVYELIEMYTYNKILHIILIIMEITSVYLYFFF